MPPPSGKNNRFYLTRGRIQLARTVLYRAAYLGERGVQVVTYGDQRCDNNNCDKCCDETVLNSGSSLLVTEKFCNHDVLPALYKPEPD